MPALKSRSNSLAGLTLDAVLGGATVIPPPPPLPPPPLPQKSIEKKRITTQTLFDIIREEYIKEGQKDRTTWQIFREKLRIKRSGSAWTSSLPIPTSDILLPSPKHVGPTCPFPMSDPGRGMFTRGSSMRVGSGKNFNDSSDVSVPQFSRHDSVRDHGDGEEDNRRHHPVVTFSDERTMSARDAVAAQEAAEAAAAAEESDEEDEDYEDDSGEGGDKKSSTTSAPKQAMSLMDLLEETDRQMGLTGPSYAMDDDEEEYEDDGDENYEEEEDGGDLNCCVCMEKIKGASFTPCGHTFCKLCSKELMAQKGHCPICSSFVVEFLEIF